MFGQVKLVLVGKHSMRLTHDALNNEIYARRDEQILTKMKFIRQSIGPKQATFTVANLTQNQDGDVSGIAMLLRIHRGRKFENRPSLARRSLR